MRENTPEYFKAGNKINAMHCRLSAIEKLILETESTSLADAAAQLLLVKSYLQDHEGMEGLERAVMSAFFVVTRAAGVNPFDIGYEYYTGDFELPEDCKDLAPITMAT